MDLELFKINFLIERSSKNKISGTSYRYNGTGTAWANEQSIGIYENKRFYICKKKISIFFIPLASSAIALGYEENGEKYIIGELDQQDLRDVEIEINSLYDGSKKIVKKVLIDINKKYNNRKIVATSYDSINRLETKLKDILKNDTINSLMHLLTEELIHHGYDHETASSKAIEPYMNISNKLIPYLQVHKRMDLTAVLILSLENKIKYWHSQNNFK